MSTAFLLVTTAWFAGADPSCCGGSCCAPACCAPCHSCCNYGCCCCRPTLRERFEAFRNACGSCCGCGCCDCGCCCCRPTLRDRINAFRNACGAPRCNCCCNYCGCHHACGSCGAPAEAAPEAEKIGPPKQMPMGDEATKGTSVAPVQVTPVSTPHYEASPF
ncbi:MAG: hypothetical protein ACK4RK_15855 [Gemmataceae bacterium]